MGLRGGQKVSTGVGVGVGLTLAGPMGFMSMRGTGVRENIRGSVGEREESMSVGVSVTVNVWAAGCVCGGAWVSGGGGAQG